METEIKDENILHDLDDSDDSIEYQTEEPEPKEILTFWVSKYFIRFFGYLIGFILIFVNIWWQHYYNQNF